MMVFITKKMEIYNISKDPITISATECEMIASGTLMLIVTADAPPISRRATEYSNVYIMLTPLGELIEKQEQDEKQAYEDNLNQYLNEE